MNSFWLFFVIKNCLAKIWIYGGGTSFIRYWVGISLRLILIVDFEGFRFSKVYKGFGVLKVEEGVFYVDEFII